MPEQTGALLLSCQLKAAGPVPLGWGHWLKLWLWMLLGEGTPNVLQALLLHLLPMDPLQGPHGSRVEDLFLWPGRLDGPRVCSAPHLGHLTGPESKDLLPVWRQLEIRMLHRICYDT